MASRLPVTPTSVVFYLFATGSSACFIALAAEIVGYINTQVETQVEQRAAAAAGTKRGREADEGSDEEEAGDRSRSRGRSTARGREEPAEEKPSNLLKLLRPAPPNRPLFLAAPGVANAQSAYFAFTAFLNWSDQHPIYVLDKDNDLDVAT